MLALITAHAARPLDDLPPLIAALTARGIAHEVVDWDDTDVDWSRFDTAVLRSTWDYIDRFAEFAPGSTASKGRHACYNPAAVVRWNTHKGYLIELAGHRNADRADAAAAARRTLAADHRWRMGDEAAIGAGSRDARRFRDDPQGAASACAAFARQRSRRAAATVSRRAWIRRAKPR